MFLFSIWEIFTCLWFICGLNQSELSGLEYVIFFNFFNFQVECGDFHHTLFVYTELTYSQFSENYKKKLIPVRFN
jgi:hypothetical protein